MNTVTRIICVNNNITINHNGEIVMVNRQKNPELYEELEVKIIEEDISWVEENFVDIQSQVEETSAGTFSVVNQQVVLKGTKIPVPEVIYKKLQELNQDPDGKTHMTALLRFWHKLEKNPSENARQDLYDFMMRNNIPLTDEGDIVVEKGVNQKSGSYPGHLVDGRTGTIDNSIGMEVSMPRDKVNPDSNQTCSYGLHVGAPDFVRNVWNHTDVIVECIVSPMDVVSVPVDYNATKMRVCKYKVMGYSDKSRKGAEIVSLDDFVDTPLPEHSEKMEKKADKNAPERNVAVQKVNDATVVPVEVSQDENPYLEQIEGMSARQIVDFVLNLTGELITYSLKSKKSIVNKAYKLLANYYAAEALKQDLEYEEVEATKVDFEKIAPVMQMTKSDLLKFAKEKFNEKLDKEAERSVILEQVVGLCTDANYKIEQQKEEPRIEVLGARTQQELDRQIEGLEKLRKSLPEFSFFGDNNWEQIDAQLTILRGEMTLDDYDEDVEEEELFSAVMEAEDWLFGECNADLFDE